MKTLEKSKILLRKYLLENKEQVKLDLEKIRKESNRNRFNFYNMRKFLDKYFGVLFALGILIGGVSPLFQYQDNILNPLFMWGGVLLCGGSLLYYAINKYTRL